MTSDYDLVLMDIQMPIMDGYEATQKLRESRISVPIIALTAHAQSDHKTNAINAGFTEFLTKPIGRDLLLSALAKYLPPE
jgi:CheY-like chemotaxis protein